MPEQQFYRSEIHPISHQMNGKAVPEGVRVYFHADHFTILPHDGGNLAPFDAKNMAIFRDIFRGNALEKQFKSVIIQSFSFLTIGFDVFHSPLVEKRRSSRG